MGSQQRNARTHTVIGKANIIPKWEAAAIWRGEKINSPELGDDYMVQHQQQQLYAQNKSTY